jgi:flagellum-specific peptidoglycan hydrolase FlgJ
MNVQNIRIAPPAAQQPSQPNNAPTRPFAPSFEAEQARAAGKMPQDASGDVLTQDEKNFFEELFPSAAQQIREYHAYGRDGSRKAVTTGTVVDRRG